jgi:ABC-type phosphate/phosphonate transport system substrate-binding protein
MARSAIKAHNIFFSRILYKKKQPSALLDTFMGDADACLVWDSVFAAISRLNPQIRRRLTVLRSSPAFPNALFIARPDLPRDLLRRLREEMLQIHRSNEGRQLLLTWS